MSWCPQCSVQLRLAPEIKFMVWLQTVTAHLSLSMYLKSNNDGQVFKKHSDLQPRGLSQRMEAVVAAGDHSRGRKHASMRQTGDLSFEVTGHDVADLPQG